MRRWQAISGRWYRTWPVNLAVADGSSPCGGPGTLDDGAESGITPTAEACAVENIGRSRKRCNALNAAIAAAEAAGGDEHVTKPMRDELTRLTKKATERRPLVDQLEGCRAYLSRARQRRDKMLQELEERKMAYEALEKDITEHEDKLEALEADALREVAAAPGISTAEAIADLTAEMQDLLSRAEGEAGATAPPPKRTRTEAAASQEARPEAPSADSPAAGAAEDEPMEEAAEAPKRGPQNDLNALLSGLKVLMLKLEKGDAQPGASA